MDRDGVVRNRHAIGQHELHRPVGILRQACQRNLLRLDARDLREHIVAAGNLDLRRIDPDRAEFIALLKIAAEIRLDRDNLLRQAAGQLHADFRRRRIDGHAGHLGRRC